ncbi:hypothetical protein E5288_WYG003825 [Bos mutus]|uniref:Uncharacterized protein n=1 Tax=Bos mutus TaxID=72004 RepID=A0A6B0RF88_9CETA|nr:hypothetical protein [Bos mutus]
MKGMGWMEETVEMHAVGLSCEDVAVGEYPEMMANIMGSLHRGKEEESNRECHTLPPVQTSSTAREKQGAGIYEDLELADTSAFLKRFSEPSSVMVLPSNLPAIGNLRCVICPPDSMSSLTTPVHLSCGIQGLRPLHARSLGQVIPACRLICMLIDLAVKSYEKWLLYRLIIIMKAFEEDWNFFYSTMQSTAPEALRCGMELAGKLLSCHDKAHGEMVPTDILEESIATFVQDDINLLGSLRSLSQAWIPGPLITAPFVLQPPSKQPCGHHRAAQTFVPTADWLPQASAPNELAVARKSSQAYTVRAFIRKCTEVRLEKCSLITKTSHLIGWNIVEATVALGWKLRCQEASETCSCAPTRCPPPCRTFRTLPVTDVCWSPEKVKVTFDSGFAPKLLKTKPVLPRNGQALEGAHAQKEKSNVFHPDNSQGLTFSMESASGKNMLIEKGEEKYPRCAEKDMGSQRGIFSGPTSDILHRDLTMLLEVDEDEHCDLGSYILERGYKKERAKIPEPLPKKSLSSIKNLFRILKHGYLIPRVYPVIPQLDITFDIASSFCHHEFLRNS